MAMVPACANAQRVSLAEENDAIANTDRDYTQGFRAGVAFDDLSKNLFAAQTFDALKVGLLTFGAPRGLSHQQVEYFLGQSIYTPDKTTEMARSPGDRPFGGWLYAGVSLAQETAHAQLDAFEISAGVVGPASLSRAVQGGFHSAIGEAEPYVGQYEIHNEPALLVAWDRRWKMGTEFSDGYGVDVIPSIGFTGGNVFTYANTGAIFRVGRSLDTSWGAARVRPTSSPTSFYSLNPAVPYVGFAFFAGFEGRAVARNIFLDGNTFATSPSVTRNVFVGDLIGGMEIWTQAGTSLNFSMIYRTREYTTQPANALFGSVSASLKF